MKKPAPKVADAFRPIPNDLYPINEAASVARISHWTIRHWIHQRRISCWGRPGYYRVSLAEILPCISPADPIEYKRLSKPGPKPKGRQAEAQLDRHAIAKG